MAATSLRDEPAGDGDARTPAHGLPDVRIPAWTPPLFFDAAAGLPPSPQCVKWLTAGFANAWADPNGRHGPAARSAAVLAQARSEIANVLQCAADEVWFAPNADVALSTAIRAVAAARTGLPIISSPLERLSVLRTLDDLQPDHDLHLLPVDRHGRVDPADPALRREAAAVVVQCANREIGTCQDLPAIAGARRGDAVLIVDASAVRSPADLPAVYDVLVVEPAMWGGPDAVAILACRSGTPWRTVPPAVAGDRFPGRLSVAQAAAAAMTMPVAGAALAEESRTRRLVQRLLQRLKESVPDLVLLGSPEHRLGHVLALSLLYVNAEQLTDGLAERGFAVHSGSACTRETRRPSHVLTAIGALTHGNLRISLAPGCPVEDVDRLGEAIAELVGAQRREAGVS